MFVYHICLSLCDISITRERKIEKEKETERKEIQNEQK